MFQASVVLVLLVLLASGGQLKGPKCVRTFRELEESLINRYTNMESIRNAFYPPSRETTNTVNVYYFFDYGKVFHERNLDLSMHNYAFRWSLSSIFFLVRPDQLRYLSLFVYNGRTANVH